MSPSQNGLAIEKRIQDLIEASKQQDVAVERHHVSRAALERKIKLWQRNLDNEHGRSEPQRQTALAPLPIVHGPEKRPAQNDVENNAETENISESSVASGQREVRDFAKIGGTIGDVQTSDEDLSKTGGNPSSSVCGVSSRYGDSLAGLSNTGGPSNGVTGVPGVALLTKDSSIPAKAPSLQGLDPAKSPSFFLPRLAPSNS